MNVDSMDVREYQVREVTRYVVTRYLKPDGPSSVVAELPNRSLAFDVLKACVDADYHQQALRAGVYGPDTAVEQNDFYWDGNPRMIYVGESGACP